MKTYKSILLISWIYWLVILTYSLLPQKWPTNSNNEVFNQNTLLISYTATTGPPTEVQRGNDEIRKLLKIQDEVKYNNGILLSGNTPFKSNGDPEIYGTDYVVFGEATGKSDRFVEAGYGIIPIFEVRDWKPLKYQTRWGSTNSQFLLFFLSISLCLLPILITMTTHYIFLQRHRAAAGAER